MVPLQLFHCRGLALICKWMGVEGSLFACATGLLRERGFLELFAFLGPSGSQGLIVYMGFAEVPSEAPFCTCGSYLPW